MKLEDAQKLEGIIVRFLGREKIKALNLEAEHLKDNPLDFAYAVLGPLFMEEKEYSDVNEFMSTYRSPDTWIDNEALVEKFIIDFQKLVSRYYC